MKDTGIAFVESDAAGIDAKVWGVMVENISIGTIDWIDDEHGYVFSPEAGFWYDSEDLRYIMNKCVNETVMKRVSDAHDAGFRRGLREKS